MKKSLLLGVLGMTALACGVDAGKTPDEQGTRISNPEASPAPVPGETPPGSEPGADPTDPPATKVPQTCASLAANTTPAGAFAFATPDADPQLVDVYAEEEVSEYKSGPEPSAPMRHVRRLSITLTNTLNECGYRDNLLEPRQMLERSYTIERSGLTPPAEIGPGTYDLSKFPKVQPAAEQLTYRWESGERCAPPPSDGEPVASAGTALGGALLLGSVTITEKTATRVKGTVEAIFPGSGDEPEKRTKFTFDAPICSARRAHPLDQVTCCAESTAD